MGTVTLLVVIVVVVVVVAVIAVAASVVLRKRRSERLRDEFGPEYERTLRESDDPDKAEADLRRREKQRRKVQLRDLDERERAEYRDRWDTVQREFVDDPGRAVEQADRLVVDVMSARGYPAEDVDRRADDLSVDYPVITQRYREAREISRSHEAGRADTEDLRGAVTSYRELVHALLDDGDASGSGPQRDGALPGGNRPRHDDVRDERDRSRERDDRGGDDRGRDGDDRDRDGRGRDDRDGDGRRARDVVRDKVAGRDDDPGRDGDRGPRSDRDGDRGNDRRGDADRHDDLDRNGVGDRNGDADRNGDGDRDRRSFRDVVRDKVTGRDGDDRRAGTGAGPDDDRDGRGSGGGTDRTSWERGKHAFRTDDDPRREPTT